MNQQMVNEKPSFRWFTYLSAGCLLILCLTLALTIFIIKPYQTLLELSVTPTVTVTPVPKVLVHQSSSESRVIHEDFSSNKREWGLYYTVGKLEVINGKLILQSNVQGNYAIGKSRQLDLKKDTYYIQADFTTDTDRGFAYGLVFGLNESLGTYYLYEISPRTSYFRLLKFNAGKWTELIPFSYAELNPYPMVNTLSVSFDEGEIELYNNGMLVSSLVDDYYFRSAGVGVFVSETEYRLVVDNFFVSVEK